MSDGSLQTRLTVLGRFARERFRFLMEHHPKEFARLQQAGELDAHLALIEEEAATQRDQLFSQDVREHMAATATDDKREAVFRAAIVRADSEVMRTIVLVRP